MTPSPRLNRFGLEGMEHWREHLPKLYAALERAGTLESALFRAQAATMAAMSELEAQGLTPDEAWEATRERFLILPQEPGLIEEPPSNPVYETLKRGEQEQRRFANNEEE